MVAFRAPGDVALVEYEERAPGAGEVLVRTLYSGDLRRHGADGVPGHESVRAASAGTPTTRLFVDGRADVCRTRSRRGATSRSVRVEAVGAAVTAVAAGDVVWGIWGHRSAAVLAESSARRTTSCPQARARSAACSRASAPSR